MPHPLRRMPGLKAALVAAALAMAAPAAPLHAQIPVRAGQTVSGQLTAQSPKLDDDSHYQLYSYRGRAGERLTITLTSMAFDAYVAIGRMEGGTFSRIASDDDGAGGTDAKLEYTLPSDGEYVIRANTLTANETGAFTLSVASAAGSSRPSSTSTATSVSTMTATPNRPGMRGTIAVGQTVNGSLSSSDPKADDNSYYQLWRFQGRAGQTVTIDLRSDAFDSYLGWGRMRNGAFDQAESDDDGGGGTNSRLVVTPTADGEYVIRANTLTAGESGAYTLSVTAGSSAPVRSQQAATGSTAANSRTAIAGAVTAGQTVRGELTARDPKLGDDSHYRDYTYQGRAGERITITLRSPAFDTYLHFGKLNGQQFVPLDTDDDGAGGTDSKVERTLAEAGTYVIRVNTLAANSVGAFTLSVASSR
jgi:hypothetical protein